MCLLTYILSLFAQEESLKRWNPKALKDWLVMEPENTHHMLRMETLPSFFFGAQVNVRGILGDIFK